jgi:predicted SAM-dependent methyltransferase
MREMQMVHVGCGRHFHRYCFNLDLVSGVPGVIWHDLRRGLPFDEAACDVIYHSHLLEHLTDENARSFLSD